MRVPRQFTCPSAEPPSAKPSQFWLELSRKVENGELTKSFIFEEVENVDGRETKRHRVVKLVVGTGRKTSTSGAISGFSKFIKLNGGVITLNTTPVGIYGSGDKRSVHLLPVEIAPDVLRVNTDFDEGRIDSSTGWFIPDSMDDNLSLKAVKDSLDGSIRSGDLVTEDLHEGFFGVRPDTFDVDFYSGATIKIRKLDKTDVETGFKENGQVRFYATWGGESGENEKVIEAYDFESLQGINLVGLLYGANAQIPSNSELWIEGVEPGKITLEFSLKKGDIDLKHEQTFEVCTKQSRNEWFGEIVDLTKIQSKNDPSGVIDISSLFRSSLAGGFVDHREELYEIYDYYQQLYLQDIDHADSNQAFGWYGLARLVTDQVVAGMADSQFAIDQIDWFTENDDPNPSWFPSVPEWLTPREMLLDLFGDLSEEKIRKIQAALLRGARDIFKDMGYQGRAYQGSGLCALDHLRQEGEIFDLEAWELIDQGVSEGNAGLIAQGEKAFAIREQQETVVPAFVELKAQGTLVAKAFSFLARNPVPGGKDFQELISDGDLTNTVDRWKWVDHSDKGIRNAWGSLGLSVRKSEISKTLYDRASSGGFHNVPLGLSRYVLETEKTDNP